jgi:putative DNA primase/helicase
MSPTRQLSGESARERGKLPLPSWYLKKPNGYRLMPGILANELAKHKRIFYAGEAYYQYQGGVYQMVDDRYCQKIVRKYLRPDHVQMAQINDVLSQWTVEISRSAQGLNRDKSTINLKNGCYDLAAQRLLPHEPGIISTIQLKPSYDEKAGAPIFRAFLDDCLDQQSQQLMQEIFGYLLIPETCAQKAFVFVGEGGAGKSTLLAVAQDILLGRANVSNIPWQNLGDRFKTAELFGMLGNIFADLPSKSIEDSGLFKSITGEDFITAERKNKDPFSFKATARPVFSCNSLPKNLGDSSEAFYRRLIFVPFLPPKPLEQRIFISRIS